ADKQTVDDLTGIVDLQALDIKANADGLKLKANQDTVDLIDGRVSSLGTEVGVVAGQISNKVWKTDIETAVDEMEYENRNLAVGDDPEDPDRNYITSGGGTSVVEYDPEEEGFYTNNHRVRDFKSLLKKGTYTISIDAKKRPEGASPYAILTKNIGVRGFIMASSLTDNWQRFSVTFTVEDETIPRNFIFYSALFWRNIKLEKGNKATDWSPAPEDTDAKITHIETEFTQKYDSITSTVSSIDG